MMIEQAYRNPGFGGDAPHGNTGMAVTDQATQRRGNQQFAALIRFGAAVFRGGGGHKEFLGGGPRWRA
jgi:hypothetical protein